MFRTAPPAPPWISPVFVPTVHPTVRTKDRLLLETTQMAAADRWSLGSVYDQNPIGGVYDLYPRPSGHNAEYFPQAPVSQIWNEEGDDTDSDLDIFEDVLGPHIANDLFGSANEQKSQTSASGKAGRAYRAGKELLNPAARSKIEQLEEKVKQLGKPREPQVVIREVVKKEDRTQEYVIAAAGVVAAFGLGYYLGKKA